MLPGTTEKGEEKCSVLVLHHKKSIPSIRVFSQKCEGVIKEAEAAGNEKFFGFFFNKGNPPPPKKT